MRWRNPSVGIVKYIMFRVAGAGGSPDKATLDEERKKNSENVWFTLKVFASYVAFLRLGKLGRDRIIVRRGKFSNKSCPKNFKNRQLLASMTYLARVVTVSSIGVANKSIIQIYNL